MPEPSPPLEGVLVLDKPLGMTSMRAVEIVRKRAGHAKSGHAGTLDPLATGVLLIAIGRATKSIDQLMATEKRYESEFDLSAFTATDDTEAVRQEIEVAVPPTPGAIRAALGGMVGTILQRPPAFSAIKVQGRRSYDTARRAMRASAAAEASADASLVSPAPAERPAARPVTIHGIEVMNYEWPHLKVSIHCGKGTYVRSIARDLGEQLGTGGHCLSIRRTAVGPYTIAVARTIDQLPEHLTAQDLLPAPMAALKP